MHRYRPPGVEEGVPCHDTLAQPLSIDEPGMASSENNEVDANPFEKFDPLLHIGVSEAGSSGLRTRSKKEKKKELLTIGFVKKYIQYAKSKPAPVLTKGAADHIVEVYGNLRNENMEGNTRRVGISFSLSNHPDHIIDLPADSAYTRNTYSSGHCACQGTIVDEGARQGR